MTRAEAWCQHVANLLVGGTGLLYAWMRYLAEPADEFAVVNHPWQPQVQHLHVLAAPLLVFATGLIWTDHVWKRVRSGFKPRRRLGLSLFGLLVPMIASGYLLQVAVAEGTRAFWGWTHLVTSLAWAAVYVAHQLAPRQLARERG
jgi:hypothetical protein